MAINKLMMAALKALSYADYNIKENYKLHRIFDNIIHPSIKKLYKIWDHRVIVNDYELTIRIFTPKQFRSNEIILFFHGGGWVSGNVDSYTKTCVNLANQTGRRIYSLEYRLAPEYPFPCAVEDCYAVARELYLGDTGITGNAIILMGDSAGGNLAAAVSLMAADRGEFRVERQILIYPLTYNDHSSKSPFPSVTENGTNYLLTSKSIRDYMDLYAPDEKERNNPYLAPLLSERLHGQPDTLIITAEYDPLRDEGEAYGEKLRRFGNSVSIVRVKDALHGFFSLSLRFAHVRRCYGVINAFLEGERSKNLTI